MMASDLWLNKSNKPNKYNYFSKYKLDHVETKALFVLSSLEWSAGMELVLPLSQYSQSFRQERLGDQSPAPMNPPSWRLVAQSSNPVVSPLLGVHPSVKRPNPCAASIASLKNSRLKR
jgi:hypothetical protein